MDCDPRTAKRGGGGGVKCGCERPFHEVNVSNRRHFFLCEGLFELSDLNLKFRNGLHVLEKIAQRDAITGCGIEQYGEVIVFSVIALETEARAANGESVGRRAVALIAPIIA